MRLLIRCLLCAICAIGVVAQLTANASTTNVYAENSNNPVQSAVGYTLDDKHLLEPGDEISFQILEDKKPATNLIVADSSELSIPYIGRVSAAGKTCRQLSTELKGLLERDFYYRATVIIGLNSVNKVRGQVLVWGAVRNQGPVAILSGHNLTAGEAILRSGGLTSDADKKKVKVFRNTGSAAETILEVNMIDIIESGKTEKDVILQPGDYIVVPSRLINF